MDNYREFEITPRYKKSFLEYTIYSKNNIDIIQETLWRTGEIIVRIYNEDYKHICDNNNLSHELLDTNINHVFHTLKNNDILSFNIDFPFEYEFSYSYDGCGSEYEIINANLDEKQLLLNIIDDDYNKLEDELDYQITDVYYNIYNEIDIKLK